MLKNYELVVVGRELLFDGNNYYTENSHCRLLNQLANEFSSAKYICPIYIDKNASQRKDVSPLDDSIFEIEENRTFNQTNRTLERLLSIKNDANKIQDGENTFIYIYYPGIYSFLISPFILSKGDLNVAYFGNDAIDVAKSGSLQDPMNIIKRLSYPFAQRYVLRSLDLAFVRDPRIRRSTNECSVVFSNPVTSFCPTPVSEDHRRNLNEPIQLLTVAKARESKGYKYLIDAINILIRSGTEVQANLIGRGVDKYASLAARKNVQEHINFVGHVDDQETLADYYRSSDVFVLPSVSEGFPRVLTESMSMKLPVVATKVGGIPYDLSDGENAILVEPRNPRKLSEAVLKIIDDDDLRMDIIKSGYKKGKQRIDQSPLEQHKLNIISALDS